MRGRSRFLGVAGSFVLQVASKDAYGQPQLAVASIDPIGVRFVLASALVPGHQGATEKELLAVRVAVTPDSLKKLEPSAQATTLR